jgi:saccharopine dehydrogenase-like NADP-dependent oxidoreductase
MHPILIMGSGKIGTLIAFLLANTKEYRVFLSDIKPDQHRLGRLASLPHCEVVTLNAEEESSVLDFIKQRQIEAVLSCLPYYHNTRVATVASRANIHYFDLTEDVNVTHTIQTLSKQSKHAFVPQCGLAPGFIGLVTHHLMQHFEKCDNVKMRVGALPQHSSNALHYALTWSTDGLINEYGNPCEAIEGGEVVSVPPLEGLEEIIIDGIPYEAFHTSGGAGNLINAYKGKVKQLDYKTIRYPGHCEKMKFLMNDLNLNERRDTLKQILEGALPYTHEDKVLVYVSVTGLQQGKHTEERYVKQFYPQMIGDHLWSAIQLTTASSLCAIVDVVFSHPDHYHGFIPQESFQWEAFITNRFGKYFLNH